MRNKLIVWGLILVTSVIILPPATFASSSEKTHSVTTYEYSPATAIQRRGRRGRGRDDNNWNRGRRNRGGHLNRGRNRTRIVRQVYYRNGRRYVRNVRVRY